MRKKVYKGKCEKRKVEKCERVCRTYDAIQAAYVNILEENPDIVEFQCNVILDGFEEGDYMTDFVCKKKGGDLMVRECVFRRLIEKPMTVKLLEASRRYWEKRGIVDWGLVVDAEK